MLDGLSQYVKSIAYFMVFMTLTDIILPETRLRGYIKLILSLLLVFIMLRPIDKIIVGGIDAGLDDIFNRINSEMQVSIAQNSSEFYTEKQKQLIMNDVNESIRERLNKLCGSDIEISGVSAEFNDDFEFLDSIYVEMKGSGNCADLKNIISSAYNVSQENIYITVKTNEGS